MGGLGSLLHERLQRSEGLHRELGRVYAKNLRTFARLVAERGHHERWDGRAYPQGLEGERIPLFGRILAVVDVFEAVTSHRPYREPMPLDEAVALIGGGSGAQFEPRLVSVFLQAYEAGEITLEGAGAPAFGDQPLSLEDLRPGERLGPHPEPAHLGRPRAGKVGHGEL